MTDDRTVHAVTAEGFQVVRYDRSGKWYREGAAGKRVHLRIADAVSLAAASGSSWREGLPGGSYFDAQVRKSRAVGGTGNQ